MIVLSIFLPRWAEKLSRNASRKQKESYKTNQNEFRLLLKLQGRVNCVFEFKRRHFRSVFS